MSEIDGLSNRSLLLLLFSLIRGSYRSEMFTEKTITVIIEWKYSTVCGRI